MWFFFSPEAEGIHRFGNIFGVGYTFNREGYTLAKREIGKRITILSKKNSRSISS